MARLQRESSRSITIESVPVWDLPVRLFHWTLVVLLSVSWWTGQQGGNAMIYHMWSGYAILTLLSFRLLWGIWGSTHARFGQFLRGHRTTFGYALDLIWGKADSYVGHNPLGGWMIIILLLALLVQAGTGLFANDDIFIEGPLYDWVSKETSDTLTWIHKSNVDILLILIGLHITAVFFYFLKGENLIIPMITGRKRLPADYPKSPSDNANPWRALLLFGLTTIGVYLLVR